LPALTWANNIQVSNIDLIGQNTSAGTNNAANYSLIQFNLSWENSWRISSGPANWDAAWVFVKFRVGLSDPTFTGVSNSGTTITVSSTANLRVGMPVRVTAGTGAFAANTVISSITNGTQFVVSASPSSALSGATIECVRIWEHARLNNTGHTAATGSTVDAGLLTPGSTFNATTNPAVGTYVYRSANGSGTNSFSGMQLRWNYGANGVADNAIVAVQVFAIEMVYVPGGVNFNVGGGGGDVAFTSTTINTANAATAPSGTGSLGGQAGGYPTGQTAPASTWPNGYNAAYCMKYEITQGQYRDFLNMLNRFQQLTHVTVTSVGNYAGGYNWGTGWTSNSSLSDPEDRIGIRWVLDPGGVSSRTFACDLNKSASLITGINEANDGADIAMGQLTWADGCAYLDWAGLRPMTETEFEKFCRGNQAAVSREYAWGTASVTYITAVTNSGTSTEGSGTSGGNAVGGRAGNNAAYFDGAARVGMFATSGSTRVQAGASYYGIMELSGNIQDRVVGLFFTEGRSFTGIHGDGSLSASGYADVTNWPGLTSGEVTVIKGSFFKGGAWHNALIFLEVSDRTFYNSSDELRRSCFGMRGVRSVQ
jgi:formylglycine-generating enzyme required for sulfatase activity